MEPAALVDAVTALGSPDDAGLLDRLVQAAGHALDADLVLVGALGAGDEAMPPLAWWRQGDGAAPPAYRLAGSPAADMAAGTCVVVPRGAAALWADDSTIAAIGAEAYAAAGLTDRHGARAGLFVALARRPFADPARARVLITAFAGRASAALVSADAASRLAMADSAQREALATAAASEARLRHFAEASSDWFWEQDETLRFTYISPGLLTVSGIDPAEVVGRTREELQARGVLVRDAETNAHLREAVSRCEPFRDLEYAQHSADGTQRRFSISGVPVHGPDGRFAGYRGTGRDITALHEARERARQTEQRLRDAIASIPVAFIMLGPDGRLVECNQRYRDFYPAVSALLDAGATYPEALTQRLNAQQDLANHAARMERLRWRLSQHARAAGEGLHMYTPGGRDVMVSETRMQDGGVVAVHTDITQLMALQKDLVAAREAAEQALAVRTRFLANISHELRTPLNAIIGFAELTAMQTQGPLNERYLDYARIIKRSGEFLLSLIVDILDIAKIEAGKMTVVREPVDIVACAREVAELLDLLATQKGLSLRLVCDGPVPPVSGDARRLKQVMQNLLGNAIKFTERGEVSLSVSQRDGQCLIEIADTGRGMSADDIAFAMVPFQQRRGGGPHEVTEGTGLGLPLVKALVESHDGRFILESAPGVGTVARVVLPLL